jgi:hypothetical protein
MSTDYFTITQCANGWIVRKNEWGSVMDSHFPETFVFQTMAGVAAYVIAAVGEKPGTAMPKRDAKGKFLKTRKGAAKP